uniref:Uncharacterized protein n=1 Tax=Aegilops tauschii TaxID=37682 RepID=M8CX78_AEGTA
MECGIPAKQVQTPVPMDQPGQPEAASVQPVVPMDQPGQPEAASLQPAVPMDQPGQPEAASVQPVVPMDQPGQPEAASLQPAVPMDQPGQPEAASLQPVVLTDQPEPVQPWEYSLRKYLLLLPPLVAAHDGQPAGDPIIRYTHYHRYLAFFYCNATAFAASLVVIVLILVLAIRHDKKGKDSRWVVVPLRGVMVADLLSLMASGTPPGAATAQATPFSRTNIARA